MEKRDETRAARVFEHHLRRILSARRDIPDWKVWWDLEMESVREALNAYGVGHKVEDKHG